MPCDRALIVSRIERRIAPIGASRLSLRKMFPDPKPTSRPFICGSMYAAKNAMVSASRYSRSNLRDSGRLARICSSVYVLPALSHDASQIIRPSPMRPTTPPCEARTVFAAPPAGAAWPNLGPSAMESSSSLMSRNLGSMPCTSMAGSAPAKTRALPSASAICVKWSLSVNSPMEKVLPWFFGSRAQPTLHGSGTPSSPSMMWRLVSGVSRMALRVRSSVMSPVFGVLPWGFAVGFVRVALAMMVLTFCTVCLTLSSMFRLLSGWCAEGVAGVWWAMCVILSIQFDMRSIALPLE